MLCYIHFVLRFRLLKSMLQYGNDWLHEAEEETIGHEEQNLRLNAPVFKKKTVREYWGHTASILDLSWSKNNHLHQYIHMIQPTNTTITPECLRNLSSRNSSKNLPYHSTTKIAKFNPSVRSLQPCTTTDLSWCTAVDTVVDLKRSQLMVVGRGLGRGGTRGSRRDWGGRDGNGCG